MEDLLEDAAACLGVLIALGSIALSRWTGSLYWDPVGTIAIGLLLGSVATWLVARNKTLLLGPSVHPAVRERIRQIVLAQPSVREVAGMKTKVLDTNSYDVTVNVVFRGEALAAGISDDPTWNPARFADQLVELLGQEIDAIEKAVQTEISEVHHLDIEPH